MKKINRNIDQMVIADISGTQIVGEIILVSPEDHSEYNIVVNNLQFLSPGTKNWSPGNKKQQYIKSEQILEILPTDQFIEKHFDLLL